jgi:iron complex outermembrane receptor protein
MKKALPLAFLFITTCTQIMGQNHCKGIIKDSNGKNQEFVAVMLTNAQDSSQFIGTASDVNGKFEFNNIPYSSFFITATAVGYTNTSSGIIEAGMQDTLSLVMVQTTETIQEFTLESKVNKIEIEPGKITLNVENSSLTTGNTALDLLRRIPGVFVDNDGNISVKGKMGVNVYIDGRPTYMSGTQLKNFLKTLYATNIAKIEVITQPDAKYDAEGNAGIINIVLRKKIALGFNGTFDAWYGQGFYASGGGSFNFNYGKGKWNVYGSYAFNHSQGYSLSTPTRQIDSAIYNRNYWGVPILNSHTIKLNIDYEINKKWNFGIGINGGVSHNEWLGSSKSTFQQTNSSLVDSVQVVSDLTQWYDYNVSLNIYTDWKIDSLGQKLTINADGGTFQERTHGRYGYQFLDAYGAPLRLAPDLTYTLEPNLYLVSGKVDYINPHVFKKFKLEAGIKSSYVTNEANVIYKTLDGSNNEINIPQMSNHYLYQENINAVYISLKRTFKTVTLKAGLRGEHTNITGTQLNTGEVNRQNYVSFFPTAGLSVNPNANHSFTFMFSRRINRPEYNELNPFIFLLDNYTSFQGNPSLRPQFSYNFELNYTMFQVFTFNTSYSLITNNLINTFRFDSVYTQRLVFSKSNVGETHNFTAGGTFMMPVTSWWYVLLSGNAIYNSIVDPTLNINRAGWCGMFSGYFEFTLPKKFTLELSGYFVTQQPAGQQLIQPMGDMSAGISKKLFKDQLTLKFNVSDIFRTTRYRVVTSLPTGDAFGTTIWWDSRIFNFSASFTFGRAIKDIQEKEKDDLYKRVGGGR